MAYIRERGKGWTISIYLGRDKNGKRDDHHETVYFSTRKEVEKYARELEEKIKNVVCPNMTLEQYLCSWLKRVENKVEERTYEVYQYHIKKILEVLDGSKKLISLKTYQIQEAFDRFSLAPKTIRGILTTFRTAMRQAVAWELIPKDPTFGVKTPKVKKQTKKNVLTTEEYIKYINTCKVFKHGLILRVLIETGMRPSECLALCWKNINFIRNTITIQRAVNIKKRKTKDTTKTDCSPRTIKVSKELIALLQQHYNNQKVININNDLVFRSDDGKVMSYTIVKKTHERILKKAGLPKIRVYDLRHTTASLLLEQGHSLADVAQLLGHSTTATTANTYVHSVRQAHGYTINADTEADSEE